MRVPPQELPAESGNGKHRVMPGDCTDFFRISCVMTPAPVCAHPIVGSRVDDVLNDLFKLSVCHVTPRL